MEYITTKEASAKWGISTTRITILANEGRIPGAQKLGKSWLIPATATKPEVLKNNQAASQKKATDEFSFPLYYFRPDWSSAMASQLSGQQKKLMEAQRAVLECRYRDAYPICKAILRAPEDKITEIGCLNTVGLCCVAMNKPKEFSKTYLRLQMILSEDFPHRDDLVIVLDTLKTYIDTISASAHITSCNTEVHDQSIPLTCSQIGYIHMAKELIEPGSADVSLLELNLRFLSSTSSIIIVEMMHFYLLGIYYLRQDVTSAVRHAKLAIQIAYENKYYFPIANFYHYFAPILAPIIAEYPESFQSRCNEVITQYTNNFTAFLSSLDEFSTVSQLTDAEYPYIYAVLMDMPNNVIAEKMGVSQQTVKRRLVKLYEKLGVNTKKELRDYLHDYM